MKPRGSPLRSARLLEMKWGHIKHDVGKFCGAYKQVYDCKESSTSLDDVLERALEYYKDRHPKQAAFAYLHCWGLLKEVPRWWDSPLDVQKRQGAIDNPAACMEKRKGKGRTVEFCGAAIEGGSDGALEPDGTANGTGEGSDIEVLTREGFLRRPPRPQGNKAAKATASLLAKRESALQGQATHQMAVENLKKAEALQDQAALYLFTMPMDADLTEEAREYLNLRRREEMDRLKRRMEAERRAAELEALAHEQVVKQRSAEVATVRTSRRLAPPLSPIAAATIPQRAHAEVQYRLLSHRPHTKVPQRLQARVHPPCPLLSM